MNFWKQRDSQSWKILFFSLLLMSFACRSLVAPVERFINPETTFTPKMEGNVEGLLTTDTVQPSPSTTFSRTAIIEQNEQPDALFSTGTDKVTQNGALTELTASATPDVLEVSNS